MTPDDFDLRSLGSIPDPLPASPPPVPPPSLAVEPGPTRSQIARRRLLALLGSAGWLLLHLRILGIRPDLAALPPGYLLGQLALPSLLSVASITAALWPGRSGLGAPGPVVGALAVGGPLVFWVASAALPEPYPTRPDADFWLGVLVCSDITLIMGAVPFLFTWLACRHTFVTNALWRGAAVGVCCGLLGAVTMGIHCPNVMRWHVALGHAAPAALLAACAAVLSRPLRV